MDEQDFHSLLNLALTGSMIGAFFLLHVCGIKAPYGRYSSGAGKAWGPLVPARVSWVVQECPVLIACWICWADAQPACTGAANRVLLAMVALHYFNRTFIYPFTTRGGKGSTLATTLAATGFCAANGYLQARHLSSFAAYDDAWLASAQFRAGAALYALGMAVNVHSDRVLRNLRKPGETGYKIPRGGAFRYVSCANYLGELVEWLGYAVACWSSPAAWGFFVCTFANLGPRAHQHHQWYRAKFDDYDALGRTAIIPFVW